MKRDENLILLKGNIHENGLAADPRGLSQTNKELFARATLTTSLEIKLPGQKLHAFQAKIRTASRSDAVFASASRGGKTVFVCLRLSSEHSERAVHFINAQLR